MTAGARRAIGFIAAAQHSYSSCQQYRENVAAARAELRREGPRRRGHVRRKLVRSSAVDCGQRGARARRARTTARAGPCRGTHRVHRAQHSHAAWPRRRGIGNSSRPRRGWSRRRCWRARLGARLSEPQRPAWRSVARAGRAAITCVRPARTDWRRRCSARSGSSAITSKCSMTSTTKPPTICAEIGLHMTRAEAVNDDPQVSRHDGGRRHGDDSAL